MPDLEKWKQKDIDLSDLPEVRDWAGSVVGKFYKPLTLRVDADVLAWLKSEGKGYQEKDFRGRSLALRLWRPHEDCLIYYRAADRRPHSAPPGKRTLQGEGSFRTPGATGRPNWFSAIMLGIAGKRAPMAAKRPLGRSVPEPPRNLAPKRAQTGQAAHGRASQRPEADFQPAMRRPPRLRPRFFPPSSISPCASG